MFSFGNTGGSGTTGSGLFGISTSGTSNPNASGAFSFGAPSTTTAPNTNATTTTNAPQSNSFLFGSANTNNMTNPGSNPTASSSFFQPLQQQQQAPMQQQQHSQVMVASLASYPFQYLQQCFDPNHINYRFRAFFYNVAEDLSPAQRQERQTIKPPNVSDALWAQVQNDNPDPTCMIPVLANGFGDLQARARWEDEALKAHTAKLDELGSRSGKLLRELDVDLTAKLMAAQQRHQALSLRLLKIMKQFEVLRRAGNRLTPAEVESLSRLRAALSKLTLGALEATSLRTCSFQLGSLLDSGRLDAFRSAKSVQPASSDALSALSNVLSDQQCTLQKNVDALIKDAHDLQVIRSGYRPL